MPKGIAATSGGSGSVAASQEPPLRERLEVLAVRVDGQRVRVRLLAPLDLKSNPKQASALNLIRNAVEGDFKRTLGGQLDDRVGIDSLEVHREKVMPASARIALEQLVRGNAQETQKAILDWIITLPEKPPPKAAAKPHAKEHREAGGHGGPGEEAQGGDGTAPRKNRKFVPGAQIVIDRSTYRESKSARFAPQPFSIARFNAWFLPGDGFQPVQVSRFQPTGHVPREAIRHVRLGTRAGKGGHIHPHQLLAMGITDPERTIRAGNERQCWGLMQAGMDAQFQKFQGVIPATLDEIHRAGNYPRDHEPKGLFPKWLGEQALLARAEAELAGGLSNGFEACNADDDAVVSAGNPYARKVGKTVEMAGGPFPLCVRLIAGVLHIDAQAADPPLYLVTAYPADPVKAVLQQSIHELGEWLGKDERDLLGRGLEAGQMGLVYNRLVELVDRQKAGSAANPSTDPPGLAVARLEYAGNLLRVVYPQPFVRPLEVVDEG